MTLQEECDMREFERDFLAGMIMLEESRRSNPVSYENATKVATALVKEEEELPLELLKPKT